MNRPIPHTVEPSRPLRTDEIRRGRFARTIRTDSPDGGAVALLGIPDDTGVGLNHGRPGAAEGPSAVRAALSTYGGDYDSLLERTVDVPVYDAGDIAVSTRPDAIESLHETHDRVTEAVRAIHELGMVPLCLGGGHDLTFPSVRALAQHTGGPVGGLNVDAHLDVREEVGSGMPFRSLIEGGFLDAGCFTTLGVGRFSNNQEHCEWLRERGGRLVDAEMVLRSDAPLKEAFSKLARGDNPDRAAFVTIDMDAIDASQAPGVSAMNPMGLHVRHAAEIARRAGAKTSIRHLDIMELSPPHDADGRTARIAALLVMHFLAGFAGRLA